MSARCFLLLAGLALLAGCRQTRPNLIPELSPPLIQEKVCSWKGRLAGETIFPCAGGIGWVDAAGGIVACDIGKKSVAKVFAIPFAVSAPPLRQGNLLVLQGKSPDRLLVYDLAGNAVLYDSLHLGAERVLGVDDDCLVYLENSRLTVNFWRRPNAVFRGPAGEARFFNCHFSPERILVLSQDRLHAFAKKSRRFSSAPLPLAAASPFLFADGHIYYGSRGRYLVKYSPERRRARWKMKLGQVLERPPLNYAGSIVACPNDQTLLQLNRRGTILWWQALGATLGPDLLPMSGHLAARLLNHEVHFFDPRLRKTTVFACSGQPFGAPLVFDGAFWFMTRDGDSFQLQRLGSRFGAEIELEKAEVRWPNRSLSFTLRFHNLPAVSWDCEVRDGSGKAVFSRSSTASGGVATRRSGPDVAGRGGPVKAGRGGPVALAWVPLRPGRFTIHLRARSQGREWLSQAPVQVLDPLWTAPRFYLHL